MVAMASCQYCPCPLDFSLRRWQPKGKQVTADVWEVWIAWWKTDWLSLPVVYSNMNHGAGHTQQFQRLVKFTFPCTAKSLAHVLELAWVYITTESINLFLLFLPLLLNLAEMGSSFFKSRVMCKLIYKLGMDSLVTKIAFCVSWSENLIAFWKIFCCGKFSSLAWLISMLLPSILSSLIAGSSQLCNSVRLLQTQARRSCLSTQFWGFLGTALSARAEGGKTQVSAFCIQSFLRGH